MNREVDFVVRRTDIMPGKATSLHSHKDSSESWMVVKGSAKVEVGADTFTYETGASFSITAGQRHKIFNVGDGVLSMVEVRTGNNFSLQDITRYD